MTSGRHGWLPRSDNMFGSALAFAPNGHPLADLYRKPNQVHQRQRTKAALSPR